MELPTTEQGRTGWFTQPPSRLIVGLAVGLVAPLGLVWLLIIFPLSRPLGLFLSLLASVPVWGLFMAAPQVIRRFAGIRLSYLITVSTLAYVCVGLIYTLLLFFRGAYWSYLHPFFWPSFVMTDLACLAGLADCQAG